MPLCVMSELLRELVHHWEDVISVFLNTVHVDLLSATGDMHMRFALWSIIVQIGKKNIFLVMLLLGVFFLGVLFSFCGVKYKIRPVKYSSTVRILLTCDVSHIRCVCFAVANGIRVTFPFWFFAFQCVLVRGSCSSFVL